jgi:hypothetical protein
MSAWTGSLWTVACTLSYPVNTEDTERHPAISHDGERLYFSSTRDGTVGGYDIWVAHRKGSSWDSVVNLGPPINTLNEETRPFESFDGQRLYFSNNHGAPRPGGSYGGASDIYVSTLTDSGWGPVALVAPPVNNDLCACSPCESPDGEEIWFGSESWEGGKGDEDVWVATRGISPPPQTAHGYGVWAKTGEMGNARYVYDLEEGADGTIYAAAGCSDSIPTGRVFRTGNRGLSWTPCGNLPGAMLVYSLLIVADTLYAGTYPNGDVFRSVDGGDSWTNTADLPGATAARSLARLRNGDVLVGTSPYDANLLNRIYRTTDGGVSWTEAAALKSINPCKFIYQISSGAVFAGGWGIDSEIMIHRSLDDGVSWDSIGVISHWECEWTADCFYESETGVLYVTGWIPSQAPGIGGGYVCESSDTGSTWTRCEKIMRGDGVHSGRIYSIVEDGLGLIYAGMQPAPDSVVFVSANGGASWYSVGGLDGAFECLCLLRASDDAIYAGTTPNGDVFRFDPQVGIDDTVPAPASGYRLCQNFPNPYHFATTVRFRLPRPSRVTIKVYDTLGEMVKPVMDEEIKAGWHDVAVDGTDSRGRRLASGVYIYRIEAGGFTSARKMVFTR